MPTIHLPYAENWFSFQQYHQVENVIRIMKELRIPEIRTNFSWADWERDGGKEWFDYFVSALHTSGIRIMPCLFYTPIHKARNAPGKQPTTACAPKRLEDFADFTREVITQYGHTFEWIQLWNEPNWYVYWDQELDPDNRLFAEMMRPAIRIAASAGKKIVLGGLSPYEPEWVERMHAYGILQHADAVGIHAFPGTWDEGIERRTDRPWMGLQYEIDLLREQLARLGMHAESWYTETGYSTWSSKQRRSDREQGQMDFFDELIRCAADRVYWHTILDQESDTSTDNTLNSQLERDERAYHFGLVETDGRKKPIVTHWGHFI